MTPAGLDSTTLTLQAVIRTIPRACFRPDAWKATQMVGISLLAVVIGYGLLLWNPSPWLLPFVWVFTGTALTGWFVIGHDCGHRSFSSRTWVNDWVGTLFFLPLIYPFHAWRLGHDHHHRYTNHMDEDNAWRPFRHLEFRTAPPVVREGYRLLRGYTWWVASIAHWALVHFRPGDLPASLTDRERRQWWQSVWIVVGFGAVALPTLVYFTGWWGFVRLWLMPWLVYHFWMSTFTLVHHTHPDVPFREAVAWNPVEAQLAGTVHCEYPWWVERLCHHINVHIPHHVSTAIPAYHLRAADQALQAQFQDRMLRTRFDWALMRAIVERCHIYVDPDRYYCSFQESAQLP